MPIEVVTYLHVGADLADGRHMAAAASWLSDALRCVPVCKRALLRALLAPALSRPRAPAPPKSGAEGGAGREGG